MIYIIILTNNDKYHIFKCLRNLIYLKDKKGVRFVVVDNHSVDGSREMVVEKYPWVKVISNDENLGYTGGNNVGIEYAMEQGASYICILNPDTIVESEAIEIMVTTMEQDPMIGICGPTILSKDGKIWSIGGCIDKYRYSAGLIGLGKKIGKFSEDVYDVAYVPGTAMMIRREVIENIKGFYEPYFIYYEDVELSFHARRFGFRTVISPSATIHHEESSTIGKSSRRHQYYLARNHLIFVFRNAPWLVILRELLRLPITFTEHISKKEYAAVRGIFDACRASWGKKHL